MFWPGWNNRCMMAPLTKMLQTFPPGLSRVLLRQMWWCCRSRLLNIVKCWHFATRTRCPRNSRFRACHVLQPHQLKFLSRYVDIFGRLYNTIPYTRTCLTANILFLSVRNHPNGSRTSPHSPWWRDRRFRRRYSSQVSQQIVSQPTEPPEFFLLFSQPLPSQDLGMIDPKATDLEVIIETTHLTIRQSPTLLVSKREGGTTGAGQ